MFPIAAWWQRVCPLCVAACLSPGLADLRRKVCWVRHWPYYSPLNCKMRLWQIVLPICIFILLICIKRPAHESFYICCCWEFFLRKYSPASLGGSGIDLIIINRETGLALSGQTKKGSSNRTSSYINSKFKTVQDTTWLTRDRWEKQCGNTTTMTTYRIKNEDKIIKNMGLMFQ